jgi:hypothetical protein
MRIRHPLVSHLYLKSAISRVDLFLSPLPWVTERVQGPTDHSLSSSPLQAKVVRQWCLWGRTLWIVFPALTFSSWIILDVSADCPRLQPPSL